MSETLDFTGRTVMVTGVGRAGQIGNAVALTFGRAGAKIVACDLNAVGVATRVREFAEQGVDARPCAGDLTQPDIAALAVETALKHFGRRDVVVNLAGGLTTYGPIEKLTVADLDREVAINLKTTVLVSQAAIPALELFGMRRVPGDPRAVELPGGIRYLIGAAHRGWRGAVYLHRLPQ